MSVVVTYNGQQLPNIMGEFPLRESYNEVGFSCVFLVKATSAGNLNTLCSSIEEKLREPFENLTINFGGGSAYRFSHDDNTCLNSEASFAKLASGVDTETSRAYKFDFRAELPADKEGFNHRRTGDFTITELPTGQKQVNFSLAYTASASPNRTSLQNFDEQATVYSDSVIADLFDGINFNRLPIVKTSDQEQKITTGSITYLQIMEPESLAGDNDPNVKNVSSSYSISREQKIGISTGGYVHTPMTRISIKYSCELVADNFATNDEIHEYYLNNIKPHIIQRAEINLNLENIDNTSTSLIVESDDLYIDPSRYFLSGTLNIIAPSTLTDVVKLEETIREDFDSGLITEKLWDGLEGSKSGYHLGSDLYVTRSIRVVQLNRPPASPNILTSDNLILKRATRSGVVEQQASNTEVGEREITLFAEAFVEFYEKAVLVNQPQIPIPQPNNQIFTTGGGP